MDTAKADFGRRLFAKKTRATRGVVCAWTGALLIGFAALESFNPPWMRAWTRPLADYRQYAERGVSGLGLACVLAGILHVRRFARTHQFFEQGATIDGGGRRESLAYVDAETITYVVRTVRGRLERTLVLAGSKGRPEIRLSAADDQPADDQTASAAEVENVSSLAVKAAGGKIVQRVDRGEVVKWTDRLWIDPAGLRLDEPTKGRFIPWPAIDGVKDGSQSGKIEIYAFGGTEIVATALTSEVNALPAYQAFLVLLDRGQAAAKAA